MRFFFFFQGHKPPISGNGLHISPIKMMTGRMVRLWHCLTHTGSIAWLIPSPDGHVEALTRDGWELRFWEGHGMGDLDSMLYSRNTPKPKQIDKVQLCSIYHNDMYPMTDPTGAAILMVLHGSHQYTPK